MKNANEQGSSPKKDVTTDEELDNLTRPTNQPVASAAATTDEQKKVMAPRITVFNGAYLKNIRRTIRRPDPSRQGQVLISTEILEGPDRMVLQAITGKGRFSNTNEPFITVHGQYEPGKTGRLTISAQNVKPFVDQVLKDNYDSSSGVGANGRIHWPLLREVEVTAFGTTMVGEKGERSIQTKELHVINPDGTSKTVFAPVQAQANAKEGSIDSLEL